jgi:small-conductance mechanosensitive channel
VSFDAISVVDSNVPLADIVAGDQIILTLTDNDGRAAGKTRQELAQQYAATLRLAMEQYRQVHSRRNMILACIYTAIATIALVAVLIIFGRLYRRVGAAITAWIDAQISSVHIKSFEVLGAERVKTAVRELRQFLRLLVILAIFYIYTHLVLSFFLLTRPFAHNLLGYVLWPFEKMATAIWEEMPNLFFLAVLAFVTRYVLKTTRLFFKEIERGAITLRNFDREWAIPTYKIVRFLIIAFAIVVAFPYIPGSESPAFKGMSIFLGVLFSLGSSSIIANSIAGLTMTYRRVFKVGDRVKIADFSGDVIETGLHVTHLRTVKNEEVIVPNSMILSGHVINYSSLASKKGLILHTTVTISYEAPWRQVHALLLLAAERTAGLLREPPPFILQKSLNDFYVTYELNVYTDAPQRMAQAYSGLHQNIQDAFNEYGVEILSPNYVADRARPTLVPKERWYGPPAKPPADATHSDAENKEYKSKQ